MIPVYIFSYNRAIYLKNAIQSVEKFFPSPKIIIVDDNSDQLELLEFYNSVEYEVIKLETQISGNRGGLYKNLNYCIKHAEKNQFDYACFFFDDAQIVRNFSSKRISEYKKFLENNSERCYAVVPSFIPKTEKYVGIESYLIKEGSFYIPNPQCPSAVYNFSLAGFISVNNFLKLMKNYEEDEQKNQKKAKELNLISAYDAHPYIALLPFQEFKRRGRDPKAIELYNKVAKRGFYPFNDMTNESVLKLEKYGGLAYIEEWLTVNGVKQKMWSFWGESFGLELLEEREKKELAEKLFFIENNIEDTSLADKLMIELFEKHLHDTSEGKNSFFSYN